MTRSPWVGNSDMPSPSARLRLRDARRLRGGGCAAVSSVGAVLPATPTLKLRPRTGARVGTIIGFLTLGWVAAGCGGSDAPTPVGVAAACGSDDNARIQVEGFLRLPERIALTDRAVIDLFTKRGGDGERVSVEFPLGTQPNQLERPEEGFTVTSLRVQDSAGTVVTLNDRVTLVGTVDRQGETCVVRDPVVTAVPGNR